MKKRQRFWTKEEVDHLRANYADTTNAELAEIYGRTVPSVTQRATKERLRKSDAFRASAKSGRILPGDKPWNKGVTGVTGRHPNSKKHHFRRGQRGHNEHPVGALRVNKDGYVEIKRPDDCPLPARRWEPYHRLVWMQHHGAIPQGHVILFKPGTHSTDPDQIVIENLEMITRTELMQRNSIQRYPAELRGAMIQLGYMRNRLNEEHQ